MRRERSSSCRSRRASSTKRSPPWITICADVSEPTKSTCGTNAHGRYGGCTGVGHRLERAALVADIALDGVDQVGDQVVAALELDVDLGPGFLGPVSRRDQPVVGQDEPKDDQDDDPDDDPGAHQLVILRVGASSPSGLLKHLLVLVLAHLLAPLFDYRAQTNSQHV